VALTRNLGQSVGRGETLAVIESREAAQLNGEVQARARLALANSNLAREQRLFAQRVSPEQDLIAARTAATEARIAYTQAQQQVSPLAPGRWPQQAGILPRSRARSLRAASCWGRRSRRMRSSQGRQSLQRFAAFSLQPADAGRVRPGNSVTVTAAGRSATARSALSPALDAQTRQVPVIATLDNKAWNGAWASR
jgi:cobalt-zinc-cadmium efflux system membrane fusion protein